MTDLPCDGPERQPQTSVLDPPSRTRTVRLTTYCNDGTPIPTPV
ncbi:hypothetical protein [Amycolatopsis sp. DSM 110486]|nr:hypothetical protein [Amycolatopsis sp. DSM 110486]